MTPAEKLAKELGKTRKPKDNQRKENRPALFKNNLIEKRKALGLSAKEVANACALSYGVVFNAEKNYGAPSLLTAFTLSAFFGCTIEELWEKLPESDTVKFSKDSA